MIISTAIIKYECVHASLVMYTLAAYLIVNKCIKFMQIGSKLAACLS